MKAAYPMRLTLAGHPNVGKSTVFNALTGLHQHTGNWAGKTVGAAQGTYTYKETTVEITDLPGMYSLHSGCGEEEEARTHLLKEESDLTVVVADASAPERSFPLLLQILSRASRTILCLNLMDEATARGVQIDIPGLSAALGIPVIGICARRRRDITRLKSAIDACLHSPPAQPLEPSPEALSAYIIIPPGHDRRDRRLDSVLTGRFWAFPVMAGLLFLILWLTLVGASGPSALLAQWLSALETPLYRLLTALSLPLWLCEMTVYGIYRMLWWVISVMLPPMAIFFPLFTLLEDMGFLPRIAYDLDRCFHGCRSCGKQALTMCMGFGCNAAGVTGCRIIDSRRERLIAMLTNSLVPCNGRFPLLITMAAVLFGVGAAGGAAVLTLSILVSVGMTLAVSALLSRTILRGESAPFLLELPPYRRPVVHTVLLRSLLDRTVFVLGRAIASAAPAGGLIWILTHVEVGNASLFTHMTGALEDIGRCIGMDGVILTAFILGSPAAETVIPLMLMGYQSTSVLTEAGSTADILPLLTAAGWTPVTAVCVLLFTLFHWPCTTTLWTIGKESGQFRWAIVGAVIPTVFGISLCAAVASIFA